MFIVQFQEYAYDPVLVWVPIVERDFGQERFLVEDPLTSLQAGRFQAVPYIVSQTSDEFFWKAFCEFLSYEHGNRFQIYVYELNI